MTDQVTIQQDGLAALLQQPLIETIFRRRTHRVSRGSSLSAGSMSYVSTQPRTPLTELEEAVLISLTGCTGLTMPDRPFADSNAPHEGGLPAALRNYGRHRVHGRHLYLHPPDPPPLPGAL